MVLVMVQKHMYQLGNQHTKEEKYHNATLSSFTRPPVVTFPTEDPCPCELHKVNFPANGWPFNNIKRGSPQVRAASCLTARLSDPGDGESC